MIRSTSRRGPSLSRTLYADSCGCAMGARFLGATLVASIVWFAGHRHEYSLAHAGARILIFAFAGAILGKIVGIVAYRVRDYTLRDMVTAITRFSLPAVIGRRNKKEPRARITSNPETIFHGISRDKLIYQQRN
jgi:hypothetical protein